MKMSAADFAMYVFQNDIQVVSDMIFIEIQYTRDTTLHKFDIGMCVMRATAFGNLFIYHSAPIPI